MIKRREASRVTFAADNAELSERTIGCRLAAATGKQIVFYCAFGERSAMAVQAAQDAGLKTACHIQGGIDAWKKANGPLARRAWSDES